MPDLVFTTTSVIAGTGSSSGPGVAGTTITAGDVVYLQASTNTYLLADDGSAATAAVAGIAVNDAATGQVFDFIRDGILATGQGTTAGAPYFLSTTAGNLMDTIPASGNQSSFIGVGLTTSSMTVAIANSGVAIP